MRWFESKRLRFWCGVSGGILSSCGSLVFASPAGSGQEIEGGARKPQAEQWGARLSVMQNASEQKSGAKGREGDSRKGGSPDKAAPEGEKATVAPLAIPLVQGYDSFGLNLPDHDLQGRLRSLFVIGAMSRVDDRNVEIRESFLETYADDGSPEFSIDLPKAVLDRFTRVLVAKTPVTLRKAEFELKGASLEFNTVTKEGGLGGPVQMTIYNPEPAPGPAPGAKQKTASSPTEGGDSQPAPR